jgi:hypothetical protein
MIKSNIFFVNLVKIKTFVRITNKYKNILNLPTKTIKQNLYNGNKFQSRPRR